jgi:Kef-type K+ transport system membrane component KefB
MFVVGLELDLDSLRGVARTALLVSHASILVPYFLGVVLSLALYRNLAPAGVPFVPFALFLGIAMSITAFPVLARILEERGLTRTPLGSTAITCAAVDDVTAWTILAVVVAIGKAQGLASSGLTILMAAGFIGFMWYVIGPAVRWIIGRGALGTVSKNVLAFVLLMLIGSALTTERIGIHALFGAFLIGVVMPREANFRAALVQRLEEISAILFLPLFFAFTGLRTQIGLLDSVGSWLMCLAVIAVATAGKLGGSMAAARLSGMGTLDAFSLGALMNTRGLMELIVLNVGYELGILSPRIFAMMVLMALVTTFSTAPLLALADRLRKRRSASVDVENRFRQHARVS